MHIGGLVWSLSLFFINYLPKVFVFPLPTSEWCPKMSLHSYATILSVVHNNLLKDITQFQD